MNYMKDRVKATAMLHWAETLSPGPWIDHSKNVGIATEKIALELQKAGHDIDPDIAFSCGLLHDIGR